MEEKILPEAEILMLSFEVKINKNLSQAMLGSALDWLRLLNASWVA
jgi:hypothetical protein